MIVPLSCQGSRQAPRAPLTAYADCSIYRRIIQVFYCDRDGRSVILTFFLVAKVGLGQGIFLL